jgi:hypothetical protein
MTQAGSGGGDQRQPEKQPYPRGYWVGVGTMLLILAYTGVQIWQTMIIGSNNIVSQRAFVYPSASQLLSVLSPQDRAVTSAAVIVALTNSGNTPTRDLEFLIRCAISVDSLQEPWGLLYQGPIESLPQFLGPHATTTAVCSFPINQFQKITKGELHGYLMGDISYRDRLAPDIWHKTQFSEELTMGNFDETTKVSSGLFVIRGRHNCADEECPQ